MLQYPNLESPLLIFIMGFITWQATSRIPQAQGRIAWFIGSTCTAIGLAIEYSMNIPNLMFIGFLFLTLGLCTNCMALELFLKIRKKISLVFLGIVATLLIFSYFYLPELLIYSLQSLIMAMVFSWFIMIFIRMHDRKSIQGVSVFLFLFASAVLMFVIRTGLDISSCITHNTTFEEPELVSYFTNLFATLSIISSSALFLSIILLNYFDTLRDRAELDSLTGVYNRRSLDIRLAELPFRNNEYTLAMIDMDHFKEVNDTFGHAVGDIVLKKLTEYITSSIRSTDFFARYGGEEFCLIMENSTVSTAFQVIDRIRISFSEMAIGIEGKEVSFTFSAGLCDSTGAYSSPEEILRQADNALYVAKSSGRNCVIASE